MKVKLSRLFLDFFDSEKSSGVILIICTVVAILVANTGFGDAYLEFLHRKAGIEVSGFSLSHSIHHWINDGLMTVFFLLIGLEIERELYIGELSDAKNALLPVFAAIGGMVTPAALHFLFNHGTPTQNGAGIPMATDIAFALGILALLGNRVPGSLKVFLAALAIIDDLGAILIIAIFYQTGFSLPHFAVAMGIFAALLVLNRVGVNNLAAYLIPGALMWHFMLQSGIHATISGVLLAFAIPFRDGGEQSPSFRLQHFLHRPVAFLVMPLFALANTGILLAGDLVQELVTPNSVGIFAGLVAGKPLGITLFSLMAVKLGLSQLPGDVNWQQVVGAGFLGGIGFTMSIFITLLAFDDPVITEASKLTILLGSLVAGMIGFLVLRLPCSGSRTA